MMSAIRIFIPVIALLIGGWLVFDGSRAFTVGDFLTAKTGPRAGQLGPWASVLSKLGLNPRSTAVKAAHLALGALWIAGLFLFIFQPTRGWWLLITGAVGTLWYLPLGTAFSLLEIGLLLLPAIRALK